MKNYKKLSLKISGVVLTILFIAVVASGFDAKETKSLAIITTSDLQSKVIPFETKVKRDGKRVKISVGGMERIASVADGVRSKTDGALMVSTGDDLMGVFYEMFGGRPEIRSMNLAGYDVANPGNHEFDFGVDIYGKAIRRAKFPIVSSNLTFKGGFPSKKIKPYVIKEISGVKVGFFGLITPNLQKESSVGDDVIVDEDIYSVAGEMVSALEKEGVDIVVALTHIGGALDTLLASKVSGIDIIAGGHSHEYLYKTVTAPDGNETVIVQAGAGGEKVGVLFFNFNGDLITDHSWELVLLDDTVGENNKIKRYLQRFKKKFNRKLGKPVGESLVDLDARKDTVREKESNLGNLITDSWLDWFYKKGRDINIAITNSGAIRGDRIYPAGSFTFKDLIDIDPFGNTVYEVKLTGSDLKKVLEIGASALIVEGDGYKEGERTSGGGFYQVSGLKIHIDTSKRPFSAIYDGRDVKRVVFPGERIVKVMVKDGTNWAPLDLNKEYTILVPSWLVSGGDGYYVFRDIKDKVDSTFIMVDLLMFYFKSHSPVAPKVEGRIVIDGD